MKRTLGYMLFLLFVILLHVVFPPGQIAGQADELDGKTISRAQKK